MKYQTWRCFPKTAPEIFLDLSVLCELAANSDDEDMRIRGGVGQGAQSSAWIIAYHKSVLLAFLGLQERI